MNETKKAIKERAKKHRVLIPMNTGTRTFKSPKEYDRAKEKLSIRKGQW